MRTSTLRASADRPTRALLRAAGLWSVGLVVAAVLAPIYQSTSVSSSSSPGATGGPPTSPTQSYTHTSATLLQVDGLKAVAIAVLPLVATALVAFALSRRRNATLGAGPLAWTVTWLLGIAALVGMLSIGPFIVPVAILNAVACGRSAGSSTRPLHRQTGRAEEGAEPRSS